MDYSAPPSLLMGVPDGIAGTRRVLFMMRDLARTGKTNSFVRQTAVQLTNNLPQKDLLGEIRALHAFVRDNIRYVRDVRGVETLQTPERTLLNKSGDCDDKSTLLAALLESISHPARFVAVGFRSPNNCDHVYVETQLRSTGQWIPLETTEPVQAGWSPIKNGNAKKSIIVEV